MAADVKVLVYVTDPPPYLLCPLCQNVLRDPVISVRCGHTFCRACAVSTDELNCPLDGLAFDPQTLVVNKAVVSQTDELLIYCQYGLKLLGDGKYVRDEAGCQEKITIGKRDEHELNCTFIPTFCPNSKECGQFSQTKLEAHLQTCSHYHCPYRERGCDFEGYQKSLQEHTAICGYRQLHRNSGSFCSEEGSISKDQVQVLQLENRHLKECVQKLTRRVTQLEIDGGLVKTQMEQCFSSLSSLQERFDELQANYAPRTRALSTAGSTGSVTSPGSAEARGRTTARLPRSPSGTSSSPNGFENWKTPLLFKCFGTFRGHHGFVNTLTVWNNKLISGGSDKMLKLWDLENLTKGCLLTVGGHVDAIHCTAVKDKYLYSAGADFTIRAWKLGTLEEHCIAENAHDNIIRALVCCGDFLFSSSFSTIKVWDLNTLKQIHSIEGLNHWVRCLAINKPKDKLYSGSHNTIEIWDATGKFNLRGKLDHTFGSIHSLEVTSRYILAGTYNRNVQVFSITSHQHVHELMGHVGAVTRLLASPSGKFLFSGSADSRIQVWNLENMLSIHSLARHEGGVNALALNGDTLLSGSEDMEIKVYRYHKIDTVR